MIKFLISLVSLILFSAAVFADNLVFVNSSKNEFSHPHDLVLGPAERYLYVADMKHNVIRILDPISLKTLATLGEGELSIPHDVAFSALGQLLVADSGNHRIAIYSVDGLRGKLVDEIRGNMLSPEGVSSDSEGNIYVANAGNNLIQIFRNGKLWKSAGGYGTGMGKFDRAHDLEYFNGKIYVADPGNNRLQILDIELTPRGFIQPEELSFNEPKYFSLAENGELYVADQHNSVLRVFSKDRQEILQLREAANVPFNRIEGVEVSGNKVWISDTYNNRVVMFEWQ